MKQKQIIICTAFLINGIMAVMTGTLLTYFIADGMNYTQSGLIPSIQSAGNLIMGLFSGLFIHRFGKKISSVFYCLCFAFGFSCVLFSSSSVILYPMIFISGLGWGLCNNVCHLLAADRPSHTILLHCSYAIGAAIAPMIVQISQTFHLPWRTNAWFVILPSILLIFAILGQKPEQIPNTLSSQKDAEKKSIKKEPLDFIFLREFRFYICFFLYFCYNGVEACINSWLITYLSTTELMPLKTAQTMLSMLWGLIIIFRLINIILIKKIPRYYLLFGQLIGLLTAIILLTTTRSGSFAVILVLMTGIFMAGVSPCIAINSKEFISGSGLSSGILFSGGGLGATILPAIVGILTDAFESIASGMIFICICISLLTLISILNAVLVKRTEKR